MMMLALLVLVAADIPVHCLIADFSGEWVFQLGKPVPSGSASPDVPDFARRGIEDDYCYSGHPNRNSRNMKLDLAAKLAEDGVPLTRVAANLTEDIEVRKDETEHMRASFGGSAASWTTSYDEGFEIRMGPKYRYFALARYRCATEPGCGEDGAGETVDGTTNGYKSECGRTLVGWYHTPEGKGCFYGEKVNPAEANKVHSYVLLESGKVPVQTAYHHSDFNFVLPTYSSVLDLHRDTAFALRAGFRTTRRAGSIRRVRAPQEAMRVRDQCHGDDIAMADEISAMEKEHSVFDWRTELDGAWNTPVVDQGGCGSCYAIAMTYVLQSRANIMRLRELKARGQPFPPPALLSAHSVLSCSYYNQGCDGGYPYLVAKHAADFGIPLESCQAYGSAADGNVDQCHGECYKDEANVVFAENYNYVGGFYGVCGQARMMKSLRDHGPLVIALEVPDPFQDAGDSSVVGDWDDETGPVNLRKDDEGASPRNHHRRNPQAGVKMLEAKWELAEPCSAGLHDADSAVAKNLELEFPGAYLQRGKGRFALNSDELQRGIDAHKVALETLAKTLGVSVDCVKLTLVDGSMNGWEYTNHAITLVGWGERQVVHEGREETEKYWIVRNSWGGYFGDKGYAYLARGKNYAGIESQAVDVTVDRERGMMKTWLDGMPKKPSLAEVRKIVVNADGSFAAA